MTPTNMPSRLHARALALSILSLSALVAAGCGSSSSGSNEGAPAPAGETVNADLAKYVTPEKRLVDETVQKARLNGNKVLIKVSGAWCPPCQVLSKRIALAKKNPKSKAVFDLYETIELEEQHFLNGNFSEFLPFDVQFYPSLVVYSPSEDRWSLIASSGDEEALTASLLAFAKEGSVVRKAFADLEKALANEDASLLDALYPLPISIALEFDRAEGERQMAKLGAWVKTHADALRALNMSASEIAEFETSASRRYAQALLSTGKVTQAEIEERMKADFQALRSDPDEGNAVLQSILFRAALTPRIRAEGLVVGAKACAAQSALLDKRYSSIARPVPLDASEETKKEIAASNEALKASFEDGKRSRASTCRLIEARAGVTPAKDVLAFAKSYSDDDIFVEKKIGAHKLARIFALAGDFSRAVSLERTYLANYLKSTDAQLVKSDEYVAEKEQALAAAQATGSAKAIKTAQEDLDAAKASREGRAATKGAMTKAIGDLIAAYGKKVTHPALMK